MRSGLFIVPIILLTYFFTPVSAQEGNYKFENYGNQSLLLNGNVTGSVTDLGLTFYNPARLVLIDKPKFTISSKAYQLNKYSFNNSLNKDQSLKSSRFGGIPSTVAGTFDLKFLPGHRFAYSFISRYSTDVGVNYNSGIIVNEPIGELPDVVRSVSDITFGNSLKDEWFGLSWAHKLAENLGIGASVFFSIFKANNAGNLFVSVQRENDEIVTYERNVSYQQRAYGLFFKLGLAWKVSSIDLGANISLPYLPLSLGASGSYGEFMSNLDPTEDLFILEEYRNLDSKRRTATAISVGAGVPVGKSKLHFNLDWHSKLNRYERISVGELPEGGSTARSPFDEELRAVMNFGMGADIFVSPKVKIIASISSDYSATITSANLFDIVNDSDRNINLLEDFWHYGLGTDLTLSWGQFVIGATYSRTSSNIGNLSDYPESNTEDPLEIVTDISLERWRFILGFEIPLLVKKLEQLNN